MTATFDYDIDQAARTIVATMERASPIKSIASPPTITVGGDGDNSTVDTSAPWYAPVIPPLDDAITVIGGAMTYGGSAPYAKTKGQASHDDLLGSGAFGLKFSTDAPDIDVAWSSTGSMRLKVDGEWCDEFPSPAVDYKFRYYKASFGSQDVRDLEFWFNDGVLTGFNIAAGHRIWKSPLRGARIMGFGDSWMQGAWQNTAASAFAAALGEKLGAPVFSSGISGQGAVKGSPDHNVTFLDRANNGDFGQFGALDAIVLHSSVNDWNEDATTLRANWQAIVSRAMADQPRALIYGFAGLQANDCPMDATHTAAFIDAFNAVRDPSRMRVDDLSSGGMPLITLTGTGANQVDVLDGTPHPTRPFGCSYVASRVAAGLLDLARATALS